jgi:hypothetical protein
MEDAVSYCMSGAGAATALSASVGIKYYPTPSSIFVNHCDGGWEFGAGSTWEQLEKVSRPTITTVLVVAKAPISEHMRDLQYSKPSDLDIRSAPRILQRPRTPPPLANSHFRQASDVMNHPLVN